MESARVRISFAALAATASVVLGDAPVSAQSVSTIPRFANVSQRGYVASSPLTHVAGERLVMPFQVSGSTSKTYVIRALGPSLAAFGVAAPLPNPYLRVYPSGGIPATVAENDDWGTDPSAAAIQAVGLAPANAREAAVRVTLQPGTYIADVSGANGVALVEVFELDAAGSRISYVSERSIVRTGSEILVGGFIVTEPTRVVLRVRGPSLEQTVSGNLMDPNLALVRASDGAVVAFNDSWTYGPHALEISIRGMAPPDGREPAIATTVQPGAYTAVVSGTSGAMGTAVLEMFAVP